MVSFWQFCQQQHVLFMASRWCCFKFFGINMHIKKSVGPRKLAFCWWKLLQNPFSGSNFVGNFLHAFGTKNFGGDRKSRIAVIFALFWNRNIFVIMSRSSILSTDMKSTEKMESTTCILLRFWLKTCWYWPPENRPDRDFGAAICALLRLRASPPKQGIFVEYV